MPLEPLTFAVLGPIRAQRAGADLALGSPQERALLALLLVRAGQPVSVSEIVNVLWGPRPPHSAVNVIRRHVGSLRRLVEPGLPARAAGRWLIRDAGGYRWAADSDSLDLLRFRRLRHEARRAADESPARAVELLTQALSLWKGTVASGLPPEIRERAGFASVDREHLAAVQEAADAALRAGVPGAVLPELREATARNPLDEPLLARLIRVLAATGRRPEALSTYQAACSRLAEELGMDPGAELREAHDAVLEDAPATGAGSAGTASDTPTPPTASATPPPAQLPHDLPTFTGRRTELDAALALLTGHDGRPAETVVISAIAGMAGIGKTTLAVHWAHRVAERFPDGQLYVNLRGYDPSGAVMSAGEAVRLFLDALGVPPERVPHGVDAQAALYRSLLARRRFLVLLDNARDTDQVRPLLPGTPGCLTIVTSRNQLSGLVCAHGAHALTLRPLDAEQARVFLARRLGAQRLEGESGAVAEITALCAGLPLALACVAARAAAHPHFPLSAIAAELRATHGSLDAFSRTDASANVSAVFSWSSGALSTGVARLFRLLALHPGPDFSVPAAAALAGLPVREARQLLSELAEVHLIGEHSPGRYAFHDLLRAHAAELVHAQHPEAEREAATDRLYAYYLHTAHAADLLLTPHADSLPPEQLPAGVAAEPLADDQQALTWLTAEYPALLTLIDAAAHSGRDRLACLLTWSLEPFFDRRGHWHDYAAAHRTALESALRLADPAWEARGLRGLGRAEGRLGLYDQSRPRLGRALELFTELGDDIGRANTHRSLGWECDQQGDLPGALRHNQQALELFRDGDHRAAQASVLNAVGWYHALLGQYRQSLSHCSEALAMLRDLGDRYGQAATWHSIAYAQQHLGRHPQALLGYRNGLALCQELGVPYMEASTLVDLGDTHLTLGDHDNAHAAWRQALTLLTSLGHPDVDRVRARLRGRSNGRGLA
ncbi:AfsR/SARP family transcriptional regulator [Streptomyces sporangiiformans]|uniref:Tetratricopeptide repeat protein n=1 Tax=Streptomyces sporangiiformans TaxID=2315329 RepID=A0A505DAL9_9ACTN|nr:BTAD domain-containing putative transcriptional regulator [Streptomyces sporangiiformans]TPQ19462.1 tetratricopeptide repeat protein [Streptomyces sporangiiformans]